MLEEVRKDKGWQGFKSQVVPSASSMPSQRSSQNLLALGSQSSHRRVPKQNGHKNFNSLFFSLLNDDYLKE